MNDKAKQITLLPMGMELQWKSEFSGKSVCRKRFLPAC